MTTDTTLICDCGHPESPHSEITRGYGWMNEKTMCYDCCLEWDKQNMRETGKTTLYLVKRDSKYFVENWTGTLSFPTYGAKKSWHNIAGTRIDVWFVFEKQEWHGYQIGNFTQICHCKRTKGLG